MPKRKFSPETNGVSKKKDVKRQRIAVNESKLPDSLPNGAVLTDLRERKWKLGHSIGVGGFGEIYLASDNLRKQPGNEARYVIKIEPHSNGPLFSEMHFYFRVGKQTLIEEWMRRKKLTFLGMPKFIGSGSHDHNGIKYRFMIMERFGDDLQKLLERNNRIFSIKTVYTLGIKILNILEYVHSHGYIHADVKAANLMSGFGEAKDYEVHLVDFGLACKYTSQGVHKEFREDLRKAHDGTLEYTSRDAHIGAHSRRGDLEVLGYNMLQWICGSLPWEDDLKDPEAVCKAKKRYMRDIPSLMVACFPNSKTPRGIGEYLMYVSSLEFEEEPDYNICYDILKSGIKACGFTYDEKLVYKSEKNALLFKCRKPLNRSDVTMPQRNLRIQPSLPRQSSGSANVISTPCKKVRRVASATPRLQSIKAINPPITEYIATIDNPTPAMLMVIERKLEQLEQQANFAKNEENGFCKNFSAGEKLFTSEVSPVNNNISDSRPITNGHSFVNASSKVKHSKLLPIRKKKIYDENQTTAVSPVGRTSLKKVANKKKEFLTSPIAKRTRFLQKTRDKGTICGIRSLNFKVSSW